MVPAACAKGDENTSVSRRRRVVAGGIALLGVLAVIITIVIARPWVRIYTGAAPPDQFYRPLSEPVQLPARHVLGVAHNAGNNAGTTATALRYGADVIEIDVITARGQLVAGRAHGLPRLAALVFQGQTLNEAWQHSSTAEIIKLDLQQTDRRLLELLIEFLDTGRLRHRVMVSTRDAGAIEFLRPRLPASVTLLFSVPFPDAVRELHADSRLADAVGGISVFQGLVDEELVHWAHERGLLVLAWTVNDADRLDHLLRVGVDGITTANLAVLRALSR
jgi:glycerophosphoryl diester phosphodiesterase